MNRKVSGKKVLLLIFIILLSSFIFANDYVMVRAEGEPVLTMCTISQEYKEWEKLSDEEKAKTVAPPMCDSEADKSFSYVSATQRERMFSIFSLGSSYPSKYDPVNDKSNPNNKYLSIIKNQGSSSNCWAFSTTSHLEMISKKVLNLNQIYSPEHMDYTSARELAQGINNKGFNRAVGSGGDFEMSSSYLANGYGPALKLDSTDQNLLANNKDLTFVNSKEPQIDVENIIVKYKSSYKTSGCNDVKNELKDYIMKYGSVLVSTYMDTSASYYNSQTGAYYYNGGYAPNHAVLIVGWDDTYSASNFSKNPGSSGAWIVQNSYGSNWGFKDENNERTGYYYLSYADVNTCASYMVVTDVDTDFEDNSYIYDTLGPSGTMGYISVDEIPYSDAFAMNVFTKEQGSLEILKEVKMASTGIGEYQIYYMEGNGSSSSISDMTLIGSGELTERGYITHKLSTPISLSSNVTEFSIAVYYNMSNTNMPIPISSSKSNRYSYISLEQGKSFISPSGTYWEDLNSGSSFKRIASIKAYTEDVDYSITLGAMDYTKEDNSLITNLNFYIESNEDVNYRYVLTNVYGLEIEPNDIKYDNYKLNANNSVTLTFNNKNISNGNYLLNVYVEYDGKETFIGSKAFVVFEELTSNVYDIDNENLIIYVQPETRIEDLKDNLETVSGIVSYQGKLYDSGDLVTGMNIDGYLLIIKGDVTGDSEVKINDAIAICRYIIENVEFASKYLKLSADINGDGEIKLNDAIAICRYIIEGVSL